MDIHVLNENFETIAVIDQYESLLWTDRYSSPGDFEIYTPVSELMLTYPKVNNYLRYGETEHLMIIEDITIESNVEEGNHIKIVGRSLESILDRRAIVSEVNLSGNLQNGVKSLIVSNIINPSDSNRRIANFRFEESTDSAITSLTYENQFKGTNLLETITEICDANEIGFKVILDDDNNFVFSLYKGVDRSYRQEVLPYVVFKPSFENIVSSNYSEVNSSAKTFCYVHSTYTERYEDEEGHSESIEIDVIRTVGSGTGLLRKETYIDGQVTKDEDMSMDEYYSKLDQSGNDELKNNSKIQKTFDGQCETKRMYVYNRDFFLGDVCQVANEYGMESPARVTEFIWSQSSSGLDNYPTFTALDYEEEE